MNYPRKITEMHQVEASSLCQLACTYCPHPTMKRKKEHMEWDIFLRTLEWAKFFDKQGTQKELSITGVGEATLHPRFIDMLVESRKALPNVKLLFSTNGLKSFTEEIAKTCKEQKVDVYISLHRPELAKKSVDLARKYGVLANAHTMFVTEAMNWAGTLEWEVTAKRQVCQYLAQGWGAVLADGSITTCCYDSEKLGVVGHVNDEIGSLSLGPYTLCKSCFQYPLELETPLKVKSYLESVGKD